MPPYRAKIVFTQSSVIGADGTATVQLQGPYPVGSYYDVDVIALDSDSAELPTAKLFRSAVVGDSLIATNLDGADGQFERTGESDRLEYGDIWTIQWIAGTVGANVSATLHGIEYRP